MMNEIKLKIKDGREWMQPIVYENFLVQCGICKSYEHYVKDYPKKKRRDEERREKEKMKRSIKINRKSTGEN